MVCCGCCGCCVRVRRREVWSDSTHDARRGAWSSAADLRSGGRWPESQCTEGGGRWRIGEAGAPVRRCAALAAGPVVGGGPGPMANGQWPVWAHRCIAPRGTGRRSSRSNPCPLPFAPVVRLQEHCMHLRAHDWPGATPGVAGAANDTRFGLRRAPVGLSGPQAGAMPGEVVDAGRWRTLTGSDLGRSRDGRAPSGGPCHLPALAAQVAPTRHADAGGLGRAGGAMDNAPGASRIGAFPAMARWNASDGCAAAAAAAAAGKGGRHFMSTLRP